MDLYNKVPSIIVGYTLGLVLVYFGVFFDARERSKASVYAQIFTGFFVVQAVVFWLLRMFPLKNDSEFYFNAVSSIFSSGYSWWTITEHIPGLSFSNFGVAFFVLVESIFFGPFAQTYIVFHALNIAVGTLAVYVAVDTSEKFHGFRGSYFTLLGFLGYFAWYWMVLHPLREALLFLGLAVALRAYLKWWESGSKRELFIAILAGAFAVALRAEQIFAVFIIVPLTILFRGRRLLGRSIGVAVVAPLVMLGVTRAAFAVAGAQPYEFINYIRRDKATYDVGVSLDYVPVHSFVDVVMVLPESFRFFLVPVLPWELGLGARYLKQYVHSLTAVPILCASMLGLVMLLQGRGREKINRKAVYSIFQGILGLTLIYSLLDVAAGGAARHSVIFYFVCLIFFFPIGVRELLKRLSFKRSR